MRRLAILGASGHGKVVADASLRSGWDRVIFYDDNWPQVEAIGPWAVVGSTAELLRAHADFQGVVVAIGNNRARMAKHEELGKGGMTLVSVVHPAGVISPFASVGLGSVIFAGAVLNAFASVGAACIVNTGATVDHDCELADGVHLSPGVHLGGTVRVGECSWIGVGASVRHGISIGRNVVVGAGAAVVEDIADDRTVVGVPARTLDRNVVK